MLREADTTISHKNRMRKRKATAFGHMITLEKLEHLLTTRMIERKRGMGKQREKLNEVANWLKVGRVTVSLLKATRDRNAWRVMIVYSKKHGA